MGLVQMGSHSPVSRVAGHEGIPTLDTNTSDTTSHVASTMKRLLLIICFCLSSCVGYTYKPSLSYEDAEGHKVSAAITIKAPKNDK